MAFWSVSNSYIAAFYSYVPMFGETEYDPTRQFDSIGIEEQLDALGKAITAGKVSLSCNLFFY